MGKADHWNTPFCDPDLYSNSSFEGLCPNMGGNDWNTVGTAINPFNGNRYMGIGSGEEALNVLSQNTLAGNETQDNGSYIKLQIQFARRGNFSSLVENDYGALHTVDITFGLKNCFLGICGTTNTFASFVPSSNITPCNWVTWESPWIKINRKFERFDIQTFYAVGTPGGDYCDRYGHEGEWYIYLDDVELINDVCPSDLSCSKTDGHIQPAYTHQTVTASHPVQIDNLNNVKEVIMKISIIGGSEVYSSPIISCEDGISGPIFWDGNTNSGTQASWTQYNCQLFLTNDCGTFRFSTQIEKIVDYSGSPITNFQCNSCNVVTPEPCCVQELDIIIDNTTICGPSPPGGFLYQAVNNINIGTQGPVTITSDAEVNFFAGNEIISDPNDVTTEIGATVTAEIVPCPVQRMGNNNDNSSRNFENGSYGQTDYYDTSTGEVPNDEIRNGVKSIEPGSRIEDHNDSIYSNVPVNPGQSAAAQDSLKFYFYPNPNHGKVYFVTNLPKAQLIIKDILNRTVYQSAITNPQTEIDLSSSPPGLYFVKVITADEVFMRKLIISE